MKMDPETTPVEMRIRIYAEIVRDIAEQVHSNPDLEVGGKFIGTVRGAFKSTKGLDWRSQLQQVEVDIIHSIDPGLNARRSWVELLPDGQYQEEVFRAVEKECPDVEHLGSWHSHHPNGLGVLSRGDVAGYFENVNDNNHNLDFFIASLVTSVRGFESAKHFLFVRGETTYFRISADSIRVVEARNPYEGILRAKRRDIPRVGTGPSGRTNKTKNWYESEEGKKILVDDRKWILKLLPSAKSVKRGDRLSWKGSIGLSGKQYALEYTYPSEFPIAPATLEINGVTDPSFSLNCNLSRSTDSARMVGGILDLLREASGLATDMPSTQSDGLSGY